MATMTRRHVHGRDRDRGARFVAALVFAAGAAAELTRIIVDRPWLGLYDRHSDVVGGLLAALWAVAAALVIAGSRRVLVFLALATFAFLPHAAITLLGGSSLGALYLAAIPVLVISLRMAFGGELHLGSPSGPPRRPGPDSSSVF